MKKKFIRSFVLIALFAALMILDVTAQTPAPSPGTSADATTLSSFLQEVVTNFVLFKTAFINTVEGTLGGYFSVLAYILSWSIAIYYFIQQFIRGEWDASQIGRFTGSLVVCMLLLVFCGDLDNDGRRGDLVRTPAYFGYYLAFGEDPTEPTGSYINRLVNAERTKFNDNYQTFIENKLMVKINDQDMPVRYPGMAGIQKVAAVAIGSPPKPGSSEEKELLSQPFWIGLLFQVMNFFRSIIEIIDFFLLVLYGFGILVCSIIAPFMCCVFVNRDLRSRFTYPFFWTVFTITVIFPVISQACRYFAYLSSNIALGTSGNPIYTFDATTYTIVAKGDPTPMILVAVLMMLISIVLLVMSLILSYSFAQGKLVESMSGLIANTFAGLSSVGLGAVVSSYATKISSQGERIGIEAGAETSLLRAGSQLSQQQLAAQNARLTGAMSAQSGYAQQSLSAEGSRQQSQISSLGSWISGSTGVESQRVSTVNGTLASYQNSINAMNTEEKQAEANNLADYFDKLNTAESRATASDLRLHPDKLGLIAENYKNDLDKFGFIGSAIGTVVGKDTVDAWTRSSDTKGFGTYLFGDPATGDRSKALLNQQNEHNGNIYDQPTTPPLYQRADGTTINALTGEEVKIQPDVGSIYDTAAPKINEPRTLSGPVANFMGTLSKSERQTMRSNQAALQRTIREDANFLPSVQSFAAKHNLNPNDILNLVAVESSFNKTNSNPYGYIGLGQVGREERKQIGWSGDDKTDLARLANMTQSQQMNSLVFPFMERKLGSKLNGAKMSTLYAAWGSGHATGNPNAVHMAKTGLRSGAYSKNPAWDVNKDGVVQEWEFGYSPLKKLGAGVVFDANNRHGQIRPAQPSVQMNQMRQASEATAGAVNYQAGGMASDRTGTVPQYYSKNDGIKRIETGKSPADQKYIAQKEAISAERQNEIAGAKSNYDRRQQINRQNFGERRVNEQNYAQAQIDNAQRTAQISQSGVDASYAKSIEGSNVAYGYTMRGAAVQRDTSLEVNQMNFRTSNANAMTQFNTERRAVEVTRQAGLDALYQRNLANLVQTVGNSTAHQMSELFERASRNH